MYSSSYDFIRPCVLVFIGIFNRLQLLIVSLCFVDVIEDFIDLFACTFVDDVCTSCFIYWLKNINEPASIDRIFDLVN